MKHLIWNDLTEDAREEALARAPMARSEELAARVAGIVSDVRKRGDACLRELTRSLDGVELEQFRVSDEELESCEGALEQEVKDAIRRAAGNIEAFHRAQQVSDKVVSPMPGVECTYTTRPIQRVGLYIPGGTAPLPSTLLMLGVPSRIAQCPLRIVCTPPGKDGSIHPGILYAAKVCGIREVYKAGGAQAVAAMAYGTESIPKVDKICGPGNAYVTEAKTLVARDPAGAAIDIPAGPSEVLVLADRTADPAFVAADLLSQAEHDRNSQVVLVTTDASLCLRVQEAMASQLEALPRREIAAAALENSLLIEASGTEQALGISNRYAPEHLIIHMESPREVVASVTQAGSVFLGPWTPEPVGDYASGTNHVLPTYGFARAYGGVNLSTFLRTMSVQELTREGLLGLAPTVETLASLEGLEAHRNAVAIRRR